MPGVTCRKVPHARGRLGMAGTASDDLMRVENAAYEAALVPELWPSTLEAISEYGEAEGAVLFSASDWLTQWTSSPGVHEVMRAFVEQGWAARNTRMIYGIRRGFHREPRFVTEADYYEPGLIERDPLHTEFLMPHGLGQSAGTIVHLPAGDMLCLSLERRWADGPVPATAIARLDRVRPHLVRAAAIASRLGQARPHRRGNPFPARLCAAAVSGSGRVLLANDAFNSEIQRWSTRARDRIVLSDRAADQLLQSSLSAIDQAGGVRSIPLRDPATGLVRDVLHVIPVRRAAHDIFARAAAILVISGSVDRAGNNALLQVLFDLTAAEAALARRLLDGETLGAVALSTGRSPATLRNQLRSILAKTGCHRQSDLIRILGRLTV